MIEIIKPCPFCNNKDIRFEKHINNLSPTGEIWSMCCYKCGATFPNRYKKELLVKSWNARAENDADIHKAQPDTE